MGSISLTLSQFLIHCQLVWAFATIHGHVHDGCQNVWRIEIHVVIDYLDSLW